jgi:hypothetical protein
MVYAGAAAIFAAGITLINAAGTSTTVPMKAEAGATTTADPYTGMLWPTNEGRYNTGMGGHED